jgi:hypothetical protein
VAEPTSWINGGAAFLAVGLDGDGAITSGRELFGDASLSRNGTAAGNGFAALAEYDTDGNGFIDGKDPIFPQLLAWFDSNENARSEPWELYPLSALDITSLATSYEATSPASAAELVAEVQWRLASRYYGPANCGTSGCGLYDVYLNRAGQTDE